MAEIRRRTVLAIGGAGVLGVAVGGLGVGAIMRNGQPPVTPSKTPPPRVTFAAWRRDRKAPYYIGHRGAGDVVPEHTMPGYQRALDWGAEAIEISVVRSADDEIYCLHDLTLDRTTTGKGLAAKHSSEALDAVRVAVPRLGPRWVGSQMPPLPRLKDVLGALGGRAVMCIEPKDDSAYPFMIKIIEEAGIRDSVMIKLPASSTARLEMAKSANYPVFAYFGNPEVATADAIDKLGKVLDPESDAMVLPARSGWDLFPSSLIRRAVNTGVPVWVFPVHRRQEVRYFGLLGVEGFVTPDLGYLMNAEPQAQTDGWASGTLAVGELTRDPYSDSYALHWEEEGVIGLDVEDRSAFVSLGQFCPILAESYRLAFDATFDPMPTDTWQHLSVAFGHADDRYYEHRSGDSDGFHAMLRADGSMAIYAHVEGDPNGKVLTPPRNSTPFKAGVWSRLTLDVTPDLIRWSRDDGNAVEARDARFRGGYFHIGRSGMNGKLKIRNLTIT